jgi:deoxyribodipyrimidine photo-lyase
MASPSPPEKTAFCRRLRRRLHVFIFRRDLRLDDNLGWLDALERCARDAANEKDGRVLLQPLFVFSAEQADPRRNHYFSAPAFRFMTAALADLRGQLRRACAASRGRSGGPLVAPLRVLHGRNELDALRRFFGSTSRQQGCSVVASVGFNADVTPYARRRDAATRAYCEDELGAPCHANARDYTLLDGPAALGRPYQVFTPFYNRARLLPVPHPRYDEDDAPHERDDDGSLRQQALAILARARAGGFARYAQRRDVLADPHGDGATGLSPHLKFGTVSVREAFHAIRAGGPPELLRQLYWREFYDQLIWHFPHLLSSGLPLRPLDGGGGSGGRGSGRSDDVDAADRRVWWRGKARASPAQLRAWCAGRTGEPLVDAAMRQLAATGRMHNRARMVAASYLIWNLGGDWRDGERHFARCLQDYHPPSNSGGWQWILLQRASRVMQPHSQAARFDRDGAYVRRWLPRPSTAADADAHSAA